MGPTWSQKSPKVAQVALKRDLKKRFLRPSWLQEPPRYLQLRSRSSLSHFRFFRQRSRSSLSHFRSNKLCSRSSSGSKHELSLEVWRVNCALARVSATFVVLNCALTRVCVCSCVCLFVCLCFKHLVFFTFFAINNYVFTNLFIIFLAAVGKDVGILLELS